MLKRDRDQAPEEAPEEPAPADNMYNPPYAGNNPYGNFGYGNGGTTDFGRRY